MHFKDKRILTIKTTDDMLKILESKGNSIKDYKKGSKITVYNKMEQGYSYTLQENPGENLGFDLQLTPKQMFEFGCFSGVYATDMILEFPKEWFMTAIKMGKFSPGKPDASINYFKVDSRLSLKKWKEYGWVPNKEGVVSKMYPVLSDSSKNFDKRGFFEWLMRFFLGRRQPEIDEIQIKRYNAIRRHAAQIEKNCKGNLSCRPRQRQTLLNWGWNPFI
jgi:hypothetical protein